MGNLKGSQWLRRSDGTLVTVEGDSDASGFSNRSVLVLNTSTGRHFWATVNGLSRKYNLCQDGA